MKIYYDSKADAIDIVFRKGRVFETRAIGREMFLDVDKGGEPLSLEILGASERLSTKDFKHLSLDITNYPKDFGRIPVATSK